MKGFIEDLENSNILSCTYYLNTEFSFILHGDSDTLKMEWTYIFLDAGLANFAKDNEKWEDRFRWFVLWKGLKIIGICKTFVNVDENENKCLYISYLDMLDGELEAKNLICQQVIIFCRKYKLLLHNKIFFI